MNEQQSRKMSSAHYYKQNSSRVSRQSEEKRPRAEMRVSDPGLLNRTAWTNAAVALDHIKKVNIVNTPRTD